MANTLDIDIYDRTNRLGANLEGSGQSKAHGRRYHFEVKRHRSTQPAAKTTGGYCIVRLGHQRAGLEQLRKLREQLDLKQWKGVVAVINKKLAGDTRMQRILLQPGRTHAMRFVIEDLEDQADTPLMEHLLDLIETVGNGEAAEDSKAFHKPYLEASQPIRHPKSHRLDAKRVAKYFDMSLRELARILGKSHATIDKTSDSKNLQPLLQPFEAILRGRILVDYDDGLFRQWLNTASAEFPEQDGKRPCPMDIIRMRHPEVVAGLVDDALTGQPA